VSLHDEYQTDEASGDGWRLILGDSCEELARLPDESVDLSVYSPPFASLFTYSPSPRDVGNNADEVQFAEHYGYVIREVLRLTRPGRISAVHVADTSRTKAAHGYMGLYDLPGDVIRAHQSAGWVYYGRVTVDKNPQAQAIRTKSHALMFVTKNRDSAGSRPALADYLLVFKKPGDNTVPVKTDVTNEEWIEWARPAWPGKTNHEAIAVLCAEMGIDPATLPHPADERLGIPGPAWYGIRETDTLNARIAREDADERHICPLQLDFIERCVRLWSNPGETVLSPFAGIGSEVYTAVKAGRQGIGIELKASYWRTAVANLRSLASTQTEASLFDLVPGA
jgi:DNA modification methylase